MITPNEYFDEIYCLNLSRCHERWSKVRERFKRENIFVKRIEGVDGNILSDDFKKHKNKTSTRIKSIGRYAVLKAFTKLFDDIVNSPSSIENILIFEDDVLFHKNFNFMFDLIVKDYLPENWKMWYLGSTQTKWDGINKSEFLYKPTDSTFGMFAIAMKRSYIEKWLPDYKKGLLNNDHFWSWAVDRENSYVSNPKLCGHDYGYSENAKYEINQFVTEKLPYFKYDMTIYL